MKKSFIQILSLFCFLAYNAQLSAQNTNLRFMHYNLLHYASNNRFCDADCKDQNLKIILNEGKPDLFAVNEINDAGNSANVYTDRILTNCLNINGVSSWKKGEVILNTGESITNALFYNSEKIAVVSMTRVPNTRGALYKCYFNSSALLTEKDTIFFYVATLHLKAGGGMGSPESIERARETKSLVDLVKTIKPEVKNLFVQGDLNIKTASEPAFQNLVDSSNENLQLFDPVNQIGDWNANPKFAKYHTQSLRTNQEPDGGSNGGMDDRFDFILANYSIMNNSNGIEYVKDSYTTIGQDGSFYDKSIVEAQTIETGLKNALYKMSDHLPVYAVFKFKGTLTNINSELTAQYNIQLIENPIDQNIRFSVQVDEPLSLKYELKTILGQEIQKGQIYCNPTESDFQIKTLNLPQGIYFLQLADKQNRIATYKLIQK